MKQSRFLLIGAIFLSAMLRVYSADKSLKPNIVFILCDDMGYGDLGCYGQNIYRLPILIEWHKKVCVLLKLMPVVR